LINLYPIGNMYTLKDNGIKVSISNLVQYFDTLVKQTHILSTSLRASKPALWLPLTELEIDQGISPIDKACASLQDFWYQDGQDGRETRSCFGLIPANDAQIAMALAINKEKETFKHKIKALQKADKQQWLKLRFQLGNAHPSLRESLRYSGLSRLHIKQTWRHIPVIDRTPIRVGFNWYQSGRSIQKVTVKQAQDALLNLDTSSDHIQTQLSLLNKLSANTPLARVQNLAPTMRANVFFDDNTLPNRQAMNVSLPILFKISEDGKLPVHNEPDLSAPTERQRKVRSDRIIEDYPFLPSIRIHSYINKT
jgi:hypothetical protein